MLSITRLEVMMNKRYVGGHGLGVMLAFVLVAVALFDAEPYWSTNWSAIGK